MNNKRSPSNLWARLVRRTIRHRRPLIVVFQLLLIALSTYFAFWLRFDGQIPDPEMRRYLRTLPWVLGVRAVWFLVFRLYEGLWRYTSIWDLSRIIAGVATSSVTLWALIRWGLEEINYPRSIFITDAVLLLVMLGGARLGRRIRHEFKPAANSRSVLIVGAGDAGEMLARDMRKRTECGYAPIGFIDDDPRKVGERIHGVRVLGSRAILPQVIEQYRPQEVVVAIPSLGPQAMRELVKALEPYKLRIATLPALRDIVGGRVGVTAVRNLSIEDLLMRAPVGLDEGRLDHLVRGRRALVTGAGGSIGSELCRQLVRLKPECVILYERHENSLYTIASSLEDAGYGSIVRPVIGDVTDRSRLERVFAEERPQLVFHAAAHKHVPLMERHVCEAVKNNVLGTRLVAEASIRHDVDRFILISTDKAVAPSSVMGATKRAAELVVQAMASGARTRLSIVRFGNVLGSNGSVVPRFLAQVQAGGPVTVTHPEMRRYFMLIPEAVQLVLHAAALEDTGNHVYVLEMGDQINLSDLARNVIRLSGFVPDQDIAIKYVGLRPGEKLSERLVGDDEAVQLSQQEKILRVLPVTPLDVAAVRPGLAQLEQHALRGDADVVWQQLRKLVPAFTSLSVEAGGFTASAFEPAGARMTDAATPARTRQDLERRTGPPDRRQMPRGGRRFYDHIRLAMARSPLSHGSLPGQSHAEVQQPHGRVASR
jgi:FlaA1/EpsC-like NDP-sugar epimerase